MNAFEMWAELSFWTSCSGMMFGARIVRAIGRIWTLAAMMAIFDEWDCMLGSVMLKCTIATAEMGKAYFEMLVERTCQAIEAKLK